MPAARRLTICGSLALLTMPLTGCPPHPAPASSPSASKPAATSHATSNGNNDKGEKPAGDAVWPFWPTGMRLHPLTRIASDPQTGRPIIECRVEFHDVDGQTSKAVGQLTLQVYPDSSSSTNSAALQTWNQDLRDLQINRRQYDDVTRTYLFRLETSQPLPAGCELRAFFLSSDGLRMNAEMRLRQ